VRVGEARGDVDIPQEPRATERGRELGSQHLDGDLPVVPQVLGQIDRRHATPAELAHQRVAARERRVDLV
jgi:hypothetical protein